mmetsp:Transcript_156057/g.500481  ORF Transcript_156057/g.500481 Transcript_156057/m.500481 type:complete len:315 (-) Transcript_156057:646-1590(-)
MAEPAGPSRTFGRALALGCGRWPQGTRDAIGRAPALPGHWSSFAIRAIVTTGASDVPGKRRGEDGSAASLLDVFSGIAGGRWASVAALPLDDAGVVRASCPSSSASSIRHRSAWRIPSSFRSASARLAAAQFSTPHPGLVIISRTSSSSNVAATTCIADGKAWSQSLGFSGDLLTAASGATRCSHHESLGIGSCPSARRMATGVTNGLSHYPLWVLGGSACRVSDVADACAPGGVPDGAAIHRQLRNAGRVETLVAFPDASSGHATSAFELALSTFAHTQCELEATIGASVALACLRRQHVRSGPDKFSRWYCR